MVKNLKNLLGPRIRAARRAKGMTQDQLSEAIGRSVETVSNIERANTLTGLETLEAICEVLDLSLQELFEGTDKKSGKSRKRTDLELKLWESVKRLSDKELKLLLEMTASFERVR